MISLNFRKAILLVLVCCFGSLTMQANNKPNGKKIVGIWQQLNPRRTVNPEGMKLVKVPVYKLLTQDGQFMNMVLNGEQGGITVSGTYEIQNDSTIIENIDKHVFSPELIGQKNSLWFKFGNDDELMMRYKFIKDGKEIEGREVWIRIKEFVPLKQ